MFSSFSYLLKIDCILPILIIYLNPIYQIRWEFYDYHGGAPEGWVDRIEVEKKKKEAAARAAKEREKNDAAAAKMMERLVAGDNDDSDAENPFDDL